MAEKIKFRKVVRALQLCGWQYTAHSCDICPYKKKCLPGDNTPLLEDAAALLLKMRSMLRRCRR